MRRSRRPPQRIQERARLPRRWPIRQLTSVAAIAAFGVLTVMHAGNAPVWTAFDDIGEALAASVATVACVARARRERRARDTATDGGRAWILWSLLAAGAGAWAVGQVGWSVYEVGLGSAPPAVSALDVAFLAFPILVVAGLLTMVQTPAGRLSQLRGAAEGLFIAAGFLLLSWSLIVGSVLAKTESSTLLKEMVNLAYPALDAVALAAMLFIALRRKDDPPRGLGLLALGIACVALSDSSFWYLSAVNPSFPGATALDTGWVAGFLLIALAALSSGRRRVGRRRLSDRRALLMAPVLPAALGTLVMLARWLSGGSLGSEGALLTITAALVILAIVLQTVVTYENHALTTDLEGRVQERTAELHATERYYRALVQHASDVVIVVDPDLGIRYVSDSVHDVFGYRPTGLQGRDLSAFGRVAAETLAEALNMAVLAPGQITRVEWLLNDAAGRARHAESTVTNLLADPHVEAFVLNTRDETDRIALQDQLRHQAFHDPLTGLSNRALLGDRASQAFARSLRTGNSVAAIVIDLDAFKLVNDSLGHQVGDALLRDVAQRLQSVARPEDTVARIGGDEFLVLVDAVGSDEEALTLAGRFYDALSSHFDLDEIEHRVTTSIGVAVGSASKTNFEQLLSDADMAMYSIKASGKDAVQLFQPSMHKQARERFRLQADLGKALERNEFWLLYQPEFGVTGERLDGFEALIRWNHPIHGLVRPDRFIPLAEESGMIVPLGRWVLLEALRQAVTWEQVGAGAEPLSISVNISAVQLNAPSLLADVKHALEQSQIRPARVVLEITEQSLVEDSHTVIGVLHALKELGVRLAIDDFGTGYASLSYLQSMPVDILKIDRTFVKASDDGEHGRELLEAIVGIGRSLSLLTIAEGVEEPDQLATVRDMGCDLAQGYLLGRPLPIEEAQSLIAEYATASVVNH